MGGECACQLYSILEATFALVPEFSSCGMHRNNNARATCTIRCDWLQKPKRMIFSSQVDPGPLNFSSFRPVDFVFQYLFSMPTQTQVGGKVLKTLNPFQLRKVLALICTSDCFQNDGCAAAAMQQHSRVVPRHAALRDEPCAHTLCGCHRYSRCPSLLQTSLFYIFVLADDRLQPTLLSAALVQMFLSKTSSYTIRCCLRSSETKRRQVCSTPSSHVLCTF